MRTETEKGERTGRRKQTVKRKGTRRRKEREKSEIQK